MDIELSTFASSLVLGAEDLLPKQDTHTKPKMAQQKPIFDYHEETHAERLSRKSKESPFMVFGLKLSLKFANHLTDAHPQSN
ncbi:hypothetical protein RR46_00150 [Papilio xuthus]|uniref:Uncharacterized protein n=1 Tax=Papilio xuthus TaxID=66420 RepID=A0A0N0PFB0_PAPXU|nr:hypothetical protein RR46_00150 [Papilio xuthus]